MDALLARGTALFDQLEAKGEQGIALDVATAKTNLDGLAARAVELGAALARGEDVHIETGQAVAELEKVKAEVDRVRSAIERIDDSAAPLKADLEAAFAPLEAAGVGISAQLEILQQQLRETADEALRLKEAAAAAQRLREELEKTKAPPRFEADIAAIGARLDVATTQADRFTSSVVNGSKGAERQAALLSVQIEKLEGDIARLAAEGADVAVLETRLSGLQQKLSGGIGELGKYRAAMADISDETKRATILAGEFGSGLGGVEGIANLVSTKLGNFVGPILAIQGGISLISAGVEAFWAKAGPIISQGIQNWARDQDAARKSTEALINSGRVLLRYGDDFLGSYEAQTAELDAVIKRHYELEEAVRGSSDEMRRETAAVRMAGEEILRQGNVTAAEAASFLDTIEKQIEMQRRNGKETSDLEALKARFINETTVALAKQGSEMRRNGEVGAETTEKFLSEVNRQISVLNELGGSLIHSAEAERQRTYLVRESIAALQARADQFRRDGFATAEQADQFVAAVQSQIDALARLGQSSPALEALKKELEALARAGQLDGLSVGIRKLEEVFAEMQRGRTISREYADDLTSQVDRQIKAIQDLPAQERVQYEGRLKTLRSFKAELFQFTTEFKEKLQEQIEADRKAADEAAASYARRKQAIADYARSAADSASKLETVGDRVRKSERGGEDQQSKDPAVLAAELAKRKAELADLGQAPVLSGDQQQRQQDLEREISDLNRQIGDLGSSLRGAGDDFQKLTPQGLAAASQIKGALVSLVQGSEDFRKGWKAMPFELQQAAEGLVRGFFSDLDNGLVTSGADVERFTNQLTTFMQQGGALSQKAAEDIRSLAAGTADVDSLFAGLDVVADRSNAALDRLTGGLRGAVSGQQAAAQAAQEVSRQFGAAQVEEASSVQALGSSVQQTAANLQAANEAARNVAAGIGSVGPAGQQAAAGLGQAGSAASSAGADIQKGASSAQAGAAALEQSGSAAGSAAEGYIRASKGTEELSEGTKRFIEHAKGAADASGEMTDAASAGADATGSFSGSMVEAANNAGLLKEEYVSITKGAHEADEGIRKSAESTEKQGAAAASAGSSVGSMGESMNGAKSSADDLAQSVQSSASSVKDAATGFEAGADGAKKLADGASAAVPPLQQAGDAASKTADAVKQADSGAADLAAHVKEAGDGAAHLAESADKLFEAWTKERVELLERGGKALELIATNAKHARTELGELFKKYPEWIDLQTQLNACMASGAANG
jgi:hypothetical protein